MATLGPSGFGAVLLRVQAELAPPLIETSLGKLVGVDYVGVSQP